MADCFRDDQPDQNNFYIIAIWLVLVTRSGDVDNLLHPKNDGSATQKRWADIMGIDVDCLNTTIQTIGNDHGACLAMSRLFNNTLNRKYCSGGCPGDDDVKRIISLGPLLPADKRAECD